MPKGTRIENFEFLIPAFTCTERHSFFCRSERAAIRLARDRPSRPMQSSRTSSPAIERRPAAPTKAMQAGGLLSYARFCRSAACAR
ncbi:hypothetical protein C4K38_2618 [Pseudomonas chlororaphis subsp. piscium]|nr:hypothetical protein C4K38_2618 [Pseudomonas chlororaphis subsp. piscium]